MAEQMSDNEDYVSPTKEEAWAALWSVWAPALVQLHREGRLPSEEEILEMHRLSQQRAMDATFWSRRPERNGYTITDVRAWLRSQGVPVGTRGQISSFNLVRYERAHGIGD